MKVDRELEEAVKKHGTVKIPKTYEEEFHEKINQKKKELA
jgi:hypothetical protein